MKKLLLTSAAALAVFASAANAADVTPYASVKAVMSFSDGKATFVEGDKETDKLKNLGGDIAVGAKLGAIRTELAYTYLAKDDKTRRDDDGSSKSEISGRSFMLNGYYDIENPTVFKPYVGAGVGAEVSENVTIDVGYRYTDYGSFSKTVEDGKLKFDTKAHQILAGVRYNF